MMAATRLPANDCPTWAISMITYAMTGRLGVFNFDVAQLMPSGSESSFRANAETVPLRASAYEDSSDDGSNQSEILAFEHLYSPLFCHRLYQM